MNEAERIKRVYRQRHRDRLDEHYTPFNDANLYRIQAREREVLGTLKREGFVPLTHKRILDVGCGDGGELRRFLEYGARPENLYGIDLLRDRVMIAKETSSQMHVSLANAENLPFASKSFDLVMQFTVFTSVLDRRVKQLLAGEMIRVLRPDGIIIWYDFWPSNPRNPNVHGIRRREIETLFPDLQLRFRTTTLAPPLTKALAPHSWLACHVLEKIPLLRTHYLATMRMDNAS